MSVIYDKTFDVKNCLSIVRNQTTKINTVLKQTSAITMG